MPSPVTTFKGLVALMEEMAWDEDSPLPSEQMAKAYKKVCEKPPWGKLHDSPEWADREVVSLVDALNCMRGIVTVESCCGHGKTPFNIHFYAESVNAIQPLFGLLSSRRGWRIVLNTMDEDDGERLPDFMFCLEGPTGEKGYRDADELATAIAKGKEV